MAASSIRSKRFPLSLHKASGLWRKQIRGKDYYFGPDRDAALAEYVRVRADLEAGRKPGHAGNGRGTIDELCNRFLDAKRSRVDSGELTVGMWSQYRGVCARIVRVLGRDTVAAEVRPAEFAALRTDAGKTNGPRALGQFVVMVRSVFKWGYESELLAAPVRFGPEFVPPSKRLVRLARAEKGAKLIAAADLRRMIEAADPQMRAMILLGLNCGYGASDCARLNRADVAREPGWLAGSRVKTGTVRRCPLWPETVAAIEAAVRVRPKPKAAADADAVFLTRYGTRWVRHVDRDTRAVNRYDRVGESFGRLAEKCGVKLVGRHYVLRHVFRTVADECLDQVAVRVIMGHADHGVEDAYRERVGDERLAKVVEHVRKWLLVD